MVSLRKARRLALVFSGLSVALAAFAQPARPDAAWAAATPAQRPPSAESLERVASEAESRPVGEFFALGKNEPVFFAAQRPESEWAAWRLAHRYRISGDREAARRAVAVLAGLASRATPEFPAGGHVEGKYIPYPAVIAYDLLRDAPVWRESTGADIEAPSRSAVDAWLRVYAAGFRVLMDRPGQVTNYTPFGLRHAASLALVIHDRDLLVLCEALARRLAYDADFWQADLIWQEGTVSYAKQVTGNLRALLPMLREGPRAGIATIDLAGVDALAARLRVLDAAQDGFTMPDGKPIPVNDTHWTTPPRASPRAPRTIVYPDFGHYALAGADQELHLSVPPLTGGGRYGGGHYHDSRLSFQLWAHGREVLPDAGYPFQPANHRYFHASPLAHNTAIVADAAVSREKGPYGVWGGQWARSVLLGFDDGAASGGRVSYVAAASPGPAGEGVTRAERALLQVSTGVASGYVLDVFWLQGGSVHESYLRQTEDEAATQVVSAPLKPAGATMADVLKDQAKGDEAWRELLRNPQRVGTRGGFDLTWTGTDSGVSVRAFLAPQPGAASWLSRMPRVRPTNQDPKKRDDFPGWHLYRRREVRAGDVTLWGALYEPLAAGESSRIREVTWTRTSDGKGMVAKVVLPGRVDVWLFGLPEAAVALAGHRMAGRVAGYATMDDGTGWRWAAAGSSLIGPGGLSIVGPAPSSRKVARLENRQLVLAGAMDRPASGWLALRFADGSGRAIRVGEARATEQGDTMFELPDDPGMVIDGAGLRRTAFPLHSIAGETWAATLGASFVPFGVE